MAGFYTHGPTLTYVTDPGLGSEEQLRVLRDFVRCSEDQVLRVAFRLPSASDTEVASMLNWYLRMVEAEGVTDFMLPPLVHNRPQIVQEFTGIGNWFSASRLADFWPADAYSVHSLDEAMDAIDAGAHELFFGHVFDSASHPDIPGRGTAALAEVASAIRMDLNSPVITAIGGVNENTIAGIGRSRVFNVAVIRAISQSPDIARTLERIRHNWVVALIDEDLGDPRPLAFGREWGIWHRWEADGRMSQEFTQKETKDDDQ